MLLAFEDAESPMELSEYLHQKISAYNATNENEDDKIKIKIGISYGSVTKLSPDDADSHPWGYEMVMAKRIADIAKPEHILLDCSAKNNIQQYKKKYYENLIYVGSYPFKHRQKENIFSYYKKDAFGNPKRPIDRTKSFLDVSFKLNLSILTDNILKVKSEHHIKNISCSPQEIRTHRIPQESENIEIYDENKKFIKWLDLSSVNNVVQSNGSEIMVILNPALDEDKTKKYTIEFDCENTGIYNQIFIFDSETFEVTIEYPGLNNWQAQYLEVFKIYGLNSVKIEPLEYPNVFSDNDTIILKYQINDICSSETQSIMIKWPTS